MLSGYHELDNDWSVMWDVGRTFYSAFETTEIVLKKIEELDNNSYCGSG